MTKNPKRRLKFHSLLEYGVPNFLCYSIKLLVANALGYGHSKSNGQVLNIKKVTGSMSSMACLDLPYFSILPHKRHNLRGKKILNLNVCFGCLYNPCLKHLISQRIHMINVHRPSLFLYYSCQI